MASVMVDCLWMVLAGYWVYSSTKTKATASDEPKASRAVHLIAVGAGFFFLLGRGSLPYPLKNQIFPIAQIYCHFAGLLLTIAGICLAIWARATLGRNWSAAVTVKKEHELICSGPYHWVRHPIYTGIFLAAIGTGLVCNRMHSLLGVLILMVAYLVKMGKEEKLLGNLFPEEYPAYRATTKKLVPFIW